MKELATLLVAILAAVVGVLATLAVSRAGKNKTSPGPAPVSPDIINEVERETREAVKDENEKNIALEIIRRIRERSGGKK